MATENAHFPGAARARTYSDAGQARGPRVWNPTGSTARQEANTLPPPMSLSALAGPSSEAPATNLARQSSGTGAQDQPVEIVATMPRRAMTEPMTSPTTYTTVRVTESSSATTDLDDALARLTALPTEHEAAHTSEGKKISANLQPGDLNPVDATWGWRGAVNRMLHLHLSAGAAERSWAVNRRAMRSASWTRTMHVAVIGTEGGAGRTATVMGLAMAMGDARRGGTVAVDGTSGSTALSHMADNIGSGLQALLDCEEVSTNAAMAGLVGRQAAGCDVLSWAALPGAPLGSSGVNRVRAILDRFYEVALWDTGADPWAETWGAVVAQADVVVVVGSPSERGVAETAHTLDILQQRHPDLRGRCVVLGIGGEVSLTDPTPSMAIPIDGSVTATPMVWDQLHRRTRCAFTDAAAHVTATINKENLS